METLVAPNHKENILRALSRVPIATTKQLSSLNNSLDPKKKASSVLRELEADKLVQGKYHRQEKIWYLTRKGRQLQQVTQMRLPTKEDHALAVINLYFAIKPKYWIYEPVERYTHLGRELAWNPDCIFVFQKKVYVCEIQLTPLTRNKWKKSKWDYYKTYFDHGHFKNAAFQKWSDKTILPQFLVITSQQPETVKHGFEIEGRELIVSRSFG
jgi:DNA-binding HxlR family transcriptional regulator